ncbi:ABC transporter ATP-binding protein [Shouchella patagoniensis]|uniref:ABC transporter ATP-binding protein n=1 Tax=Shouchella patagoniensis TaxID=228576 RepID=UPI0009952CA1|nr:ABC transporter ATP-binding protein [Shouchella patagoniensis]
MENVLTLDRVKKAFGNKVALDDINLSIKKGEIFGLLGPSGSGKTTMVKVLTGQLSASSGTTEVLGYNVKKGAKSEIMQKVGILTDNSALYERLSVYDNLSLFSKLYGVETEKERIAAVLEDVQLTGEEKTIIKKLSKGMKQRVTLARTLLHKPSLLFLDEPTSALDPSTTGHVHKALKKLNESGTTIFLTTHNMAEAESLCDRVAFLDKGSLITVDTPKNLRIEHSDKRIVVETEVETLEIEQNEEGSKVLAELIQNKQVLTIHSNEPTLGDIFIKLTGGALT